VEKREKYFKFPWKIQEENGIIILKSYRKEMDTENKEQKGTLKGKYSEEIITLIEELHKKLERIENKEKAIETEQMEEGYFGCYDSLQFI